MYIYIDSQFSIESSVERSLKVRCVIDDGRKKSEIKGTTVREDGR